MQQEMKEKLANVSSLVSDKILTFRNVISMLKTDVRTELQHVHTDQANTIKRTLDRLSTVSKCLLALLASYFPPAILP
jgi:hypothetical protein